MSATISLQEYGITVGEIHHNLPPSSLYEHAIRYEKDASIAENGALVAYSGAKTGRSPARVASHLRLGSGRYAKLTTPRNSTLRRTIAARIWAKF